MYNFYRVEDLEMDCIEHLKLTLCDGTMMEWKWMKETGWKQRGAKGAKN